MSDNTKIRGTWDSTPLSNGAYKRSWCQKLRLTTPDLDQDALERPKTRDAEDGELVNDLRPLRGALSRVIDNLSIFGSIPIMGAAAPLFLKERRIQQTNQASIKILFLIDRSHPLRK